MVKRYLNVVSLDEARQVVRSSFEPGSRTERVPIVQCPGRITAAPVFATYSVPEIHLAAMDGIAVISSDTVGAYEQNPVTLGQAVRVNTGNVVPDPFDSVIMIEEVVETPRGYVIRKPAPRWQHVRPAGEDIGESEMVVPSRHMLRPHEAGALAAYGIREIDVLSLDVGLIPTGSELVPHGTRPGPGQVVESNTIMAEAYLVRAGARCHRYPIVRDEEEEITAAISRAVDECDLVIVSAGSSAGTRDYTAGVISGLGEVLVHGVAMKPGKPVIIGKVRGKPVIGMPGYPLSALTVIREIIMPLVKESGLHVPDPAVLVSTLTQAVSSEAGSDDFILATVGMVGDRTVVSPQSRGAGVQMSGVRANAYLHVPAGTEGVEAGEEVEAYLMSPLGDVSRALLLTGSHDPSLDYLADLLSRKGISLHSTHVGSMGGLLALRKDECHAAPMHLLAPDGSFNTAFIDRHLPDVAVTLVCVAERQQGIISREPLGLEDIVTKRFVNRQKGSGTRMLLDHLLGREGIDPAGIEGYDREVTTHLAVALAVKSNEADLGVGTYAAAKALALSFTPLGTERYEIAIRDGLMKDERHIEALVNTIASPEFREVLSRLGGYETRCTGEVRSGHSSLHNPSHPPR